MERKQAPVLAVVVLGVFAIAVLQWARSSRDSTNADIEAPGSAPAFSRATAPGQEGYPREVEPNATTEGGSQSSDPGQPPRANASPADPTVGGAAVPGIQLVVVDEVHGDPVADVRVASADEVFGSTDDGGRIRLPAPLSASHELTIAGPAVLGGEIVRVFGQAVPVGTAAFHLEVPTSPVVVVENRTAAARGDWSVEIVKMPATFPPPRNEAWAVTLQRARVSHPRLFVQMIERGDNPEPLPDPVVARAEGSPRVEVRPPFEGEVLITVSAPGRIPDVRVTRILAGSTVEFDVALPSMPVVAGSLRDPSGRPLPEAPVTIECGSTFLPGELLPADGRPGVTLQSHYTTTDPDERPRVVSSRGVQTDASGRFEAAMPFTGRVRVHAYPAGHAAASVAREVAGRWESVLDLELEAAALEFRQTMTVARSDGRHLGDVRVLLFEMPPKDEPQDRARRVPGQTLDVLGRLDISQLDPAREHLMMPVDMQFREVVFVPSNDGTITVD